MKTSRAILLIFTCNAVIYVYIGVLALVSSLLISACTFQTKHYEYIYATHPIDPPMQKTLCIGRVCTDVLEI